LIAYVEVVPGKSIHAYKNITINEPYFVGHFPHHPVMPGVLIMEALAQAAGILSFKTDGVRSRMPDSTFFTFVGIDECRFKSPVMPGDQLHLHMSRIERQMRGIWKYIAEARVDGETGVAEAQA
jgi:3-hydroxyacyl-[acyl-carrier-protein] dehydratase